VGADKNAKILIRWGFGEGNHNPPHIARAHKPHSTVCDRYNTRGKSPQRQSGKKSQGKKLGGPTTDASDKKERVTQEKRMLTIKHKEGVDADCI